MGVVYNRAQAGLYDNGAAQNGANSFFTSYTAYTGSSLSGNTSFGMLTNRYGTALFGDQYIPVDTSKTYQHAVSARTITNNFLGNPGSGHLGFACYDSSFRFIESWSCGDIGNTTLSRDLNIGDAFAYITSSSGWTTGSNLVAGDVIFRYLLLYPATHPEFSTPWRYTRIGSQDFVICYKSMTQTPSGDWELKLANANNADINMPNIGYPTPAGTPVSRGVAAGSYNYANGNPNYSTDSWTTYVTSPFTGESRTSSVPFRYGTKYIRFLNLANFNFRLETTGSSATYALDNIMLVQCPNGQALPNSFFSRSDI